MKTYRFSVCVACLIIISVLSLNCSKKKDNNPASPELEENQSDYNTITVIMDIATIPSTLEFNQTHVDGGEIEYEWAVFIDTDNNLETGNRGYDTSISVFHSKSTGSNPYNSSIISSTDYRTWTASFGGGWYYGHDVEATVNVSTNQIILKGNREWRELSNIDLSDPFYCETSYNAPIGSVKDSTVISSIKNAVKDPIGDVSYNFIDIVQCKIELK